MISWPPAWIERKPSRMVIMTTKESKNSKPDQAIAIPNVESRGQHIGKLAETEEAVLLTVAAAKWDEYDSKCNDIEERTLYCS